MASQYDPRLLQATPVCSNAPDAHTLRTSQTLQAKAEIPQYVKDAHEPAPRMQALFSGLQARYG
jgi:hypothetical protein